MDPILLAFLQFALLLVGMSALIVMFVILLLAMIQGAPVQRARKWWSADGVIVTSYISAERDEENVKSTKIFYVPNVSYTYFVQGKQQLATRLHFGARQKRTQRDAAEKDLAPYPVGARVTVYYNPDNPQDAVLQIAAPAARRLGFSALGALAACVVACVVAFLLPGWVS
jgi:hypothetical protein